MSVPVEIVEFLKQTLLPEIAKLHADVSEVRSFIWTNNARDSKS